MDLADYERAKFDLAAILRSASVRLREADPRAEVPFTDLFSRLAEDRFNLVVVGRFSRGKSSLMNAMFESDRLPTGIVPLTSVITTVSYGSSERAFIDHEGWRIAQEISLDDLPDYVTQNGNPGNQKRVTVARVELPSELLRRGFHFVDTPGLGSSIIENTRTTEDFLPEADAFMLVTSYDSPLSEEELRILQGVASSPSRVFLVVNKQDTVTSAERDQVLSHVRQQALRVFGNPLPRLFSVSARDAMEANRLNDPARLTDSGVHHLTEELTRFLLEEKQSEFLLRMCERIAEALRGVPQATDEDQRLRSLQAGVSDRTPSANAATAINPGGTTERTPFDSCAICEQIDRRMYDYLCKYQYDVATDRSTQAQLAEYGGLCAFHTWHYAAVATAHGTCVGFADLFDRLAGRLRDMAALPQTGPHGPEVESLRPTAATCKLCRAQSSIEAQAVAQAAQAVEQARARRKSPFPSLCLPHLALVTQALGAQRSANELLVEEADVLQRVAEDMRRYALKHDGLRRFLASEEELRANRRALMLLAGHRNVHGLRKMN